MSRKKLMKKRSEEVKVCQKNGKELINKNLTLLKTSRRVSTGVETRCFRLGWICRVLTNVGKINLVADLGYVNECKYFTVSYRLGKQHTFHSLKPPWCLFPLCGSPEQEERFFERGGVLDW